MSMIKLYYALIAPPAVAVIKVFHAPCALEQPREGLPPLITD